MDSSAGPNEQLAGKRLIFALLANQDEHVLAAQLDNIRFFNPNAGVVLYNGGTDPQFAQNIDVCKYPNCHPLTYGNLTPYLWEVMKWLDELQVPYEYLVHLDHDVLFVKPGFEAFLDEVMAESDCMGWGVNTSSNNPDSLPISSMSEEWSLWQPIFRTDIYIRVFNPGQVFRRELVSRMIRHADLAAIEHLINNSQVFALEEVFFVTLALACGGRVREYPDGHLYNESVRWGNNITVSEADRTRQHPSFFWIHPVKGQELIAMKEWLQREQEPQPEFQPELPPAIQPLQRRKRRILKRKLKPKRRLIRKKRLVKRKLSFRRRRIRLRRFTRKRKLVNRLKKSTQRNRIRKASKTA